MSPNQIITTRALLLLTWINLSTSKDSNYIHFEVWDEITYQFPNFNGAAV